MKRIKLLGIIFASFTAILCFMLTGFAVDEGYREAPNQTVCLVRGDLTFEGKSDAGDARQILRIVVGLAETDDELNELADVDRDGKVSAADARMLLRVVVGLEEALGHVKQDKVTLTTATCKGNGTSADLCYYCGMLYNYGAIPSPGHVSGGWQSVTRASCTENGVEEQRCIYCDMLMESRQSAKTDHTYGLKQYETAPSCLDPVNVYRICKVCGYKLTEVEMPIGSHTYIWKEETPATCLEAGLERKVCAHCKEETEETREITPAGSHALSSWKTVQSVSCATDTQGIRIRTCLRCGQTVDKEIIEPVHNKIQSTYRITKEPSCIQTGIATYTCAVCRKTVTETLDTVSHSFVGDPVTENATCVDAGSVTYTCEVCGEVKFTTDPLGHDFEKDEAGNVIWRADEEAGKVYKVCTRCKEKVYGVDIR